MHVNVQSTSNRRWRAAAAGFVVAAAGVGGWCAPVARGDDGGAWKREVLYTTAAGEIRKTTLTWADGAPPSASAPVVVASLGAGAAEGIVFGGGNGDEGVLFVSGNGRVQEVQLGAQGIGSALVVGSVVAGPWNGGMGDGPSIGRIGMGVDGRAVWGVGARDAGTGAGVVERVEVRPTLKTGTAAGVFGPDTRLMSLAFVGEQAFYTAAGNGSGGYFGLLDTSVMMTQRLISGPGGNGMESARALVFDGYTGDLLMMGGGKITQIRVDLLAGGHATVVSEADVSALGVGIITGAADGRGRLIGMGADGRAVVMDYRGTRLVGSALNVSGVVMVENGGAGVVEVREIAPLAGLGSARSVEKVWDNGAADGGSAQLSQQPRPAEGWIGPDVRTADDLYVEPGEMTRIDVFKARMYTSAPVPKARLEVYEDCDGAPGALITSMESSWGTDLMLPPVNGIFKTVEFTFLPGSLWLDGGRRGKSYWVSVVGLGSELGGEEYLWLTSGNGAPGVKGRPGAYRDESSVSWTSVEDFACGCTDFNFTALGERCKALWDNGVIEAPPAPGEEAGVASMLSWSGWETRAADDFIAPGCADVRVCALEATIYTNCVPVRGVFEVYGGPCGRPEGPALFATPFVDVVDLGYVISSGGETLRAYRVRASGMDWMLMGGRNYWLMAAGRGSGAARQKTLVALAPSAGCDRVCEVRGNGGYGKGPLLGFTEWTSVESVVGRARDLAIRVFVAREEKRARAVVEPSLPVCRGDLNGDGQASVDDLFLFLHTWFSGCP